MFSSAKSRTILWLTTLVAAFALGVLARPVLRDAYRALQPPPPALAPTRPHAEAAETDAASLIRFETAEGVVRRRDELIAYVWKEAGFPHARRPDAVREGACADGFTPPAGTARAECFEIKMPHGVRSFAHLLHPAKPRNRLLIYHEGHDSGNPEPAKFFLAQGHHVLYLWMPLFGGNPKVFADHPQFGRLFLHNHAQLFWFEDEAFSAFRYFLEPVAAALNEALARNAFERVAMAGLSGGGWTTTVYAALDARIGRSYAVAGSLPHFLLSGRKKELIEIEQQHPPFYRIAGYPELYVMGAHGAARRAIQIYNRRDPCCFDGEERALFVRDAVRDALARTGGGAYDVWVDDTLDGHAVSPWALERIAQDLETERP